MNYVTELTKEHICHFGADDYEVKATIQVVYDSNDPVAQYINEIAIKQRFDTLCVNPKKIILHDPATIIIWNDNTKTVVKCSEDDTYDPEKGIALCFMKKVMSHKGNYKKIFKEWIK